MLVLAMLIDLKDCSNLISFVRISMPETYVTIDGDSHNSGWTAMGL
jgi:hypothetical protein